MGNDFKKLGTKARNSIFLENIISGIILSAVAVVVRLIIQSFNIPDTVSNIIDIIFYVFVGLLVLNVILDPTLGYSHKKFRISDESVEYITGIIFVERTIVPIRRMQQVEIEEGPINRLFGLANVKVITAGGEMEIEYLDRSLADEITENLKVKINEFVMEDRTKDKTEKESAVEKETV